jgi:hypothetical protein
MITNDLQNRIHFGDREAFLAVYQEYGPGAFAAAKKALASDTLAKSAVKQAFLSLYDEILTQVEDFDIPVRIRELTQREIVLLRLVSGEATISESMPEISGELQPEPELFSARGAFAEQADSLPSLPSLERKRAFHRARKGLFLHKQSKNVAYAQPPLIWKIMLVLVDLFLLWVLTGMLMGLGYLPVVDLGYSWFSHVLFQVTQVFA